MSIERGDNYIAAFGSGLFAGGITAVPNILLRSYYQLGLTDSQLLLLLQILRLSSEEHNYLPAAEKLASYSGKSAVQIEESMEYLQQNDFLSVAEFYDEQNADVVKTYSLTPLFEKIADLWAGQQCEEYKQIQEIKKNQREYRHKVNSQSLSTLAKKFEMEFNRPLSPLEFEQISHWLEHGNPEQIIVEALRRAVLRGKNNFKYIDSIIFEWEKNNIRTVGQILQYEEEYKKRQNQNSNKFGKQTNNNNNGVAHTGQNISEEEKRKKDFIKSLYLS